MDPWLLAGPRICKLTDIITAWIAKQLTPRMCIDRRTNVHPTNVGSMLAQRRRRWSNIKNSIGSVSRCSSIL